MPERTRWEQDGFETPPREPTCDNRDNRTLGSAPASPPGDNDGGAGGGFDSDEDASR